MSTPTDDAIGWLVLLRSGEATAADQNAFDDWLRRSPRLSGAGVTLLEAAPTPAGSGAPGSFSTAARKAAPAVPEAGLVPAVQ